MTHNELDSALDLFPSESPTPKSAASGPDGPPRDTAPPGVQPTPAKRDSTEDQKRNGGWLAAWVVVALIVFGLPVALGLTAFAVAAPVGLVWVAYTDLGPFVLRTQELLISVSPGLRLMVFGLWLGLTCAGVVTITRGWELLGGRRGTRGTDSVAWALVTSLGSVILAVALSSWIIWWLLRVVVA